MFRTTASFGALTLSFGLLVLELFQVRRTDCHNFSAAIFFQTWHLFGWFAVSRLFWWQAFFSLWEMDFSVGKWISLWEMETVQMVECTHMIHIPCCCSVHQRIHSCIVSVCRNHCCSITAHWTFGMGQMIDRLGSVETLHRLMNHKYWTTTDTLLTPRRKSYPHSITKTKPNPNPTHPTNVTVTVPMEARIQLPIHGLFL